MAYRVMIVDDSPSMRAFVRRVIDLSGFEVDFCMHAGNGAEALALLEQHTVDIILTEINGEDFVRHLEEHEEFRAIPVVVISTDATQNRMQRMLALGAKGYVAKP